jgi:putative ABC transport system permease protein
MFKNYLKVTLRNLKRQGGYTALNIIGLTIGIASSLFILLYVFHETSFDDFHQKKDRIYRISSEITEPDNAFKWAVTQLPLGHMLKQEYAEVEEYVRFIPNGRTRFEKDLVNYFEENVYFADSTVFKVFDFEFTAGNKATALHIPNAIVLNETIAKKIFKNENPIGQSLKTDGDRTYQVTGVFKDMPDNTHIIVDAMVSAQTVVPAGVGNWGGFNIYTYVLLQPNVTPADFQPKLDEILEKHVDVIFKSLNIEVKYEMLLLTDIHLTSDFEGEPVPIGSMDYVYIFSGVGLFLIIIACINYMNLATARSARRSMEVGIRKVMGANRGGLIGQFLAESVVITLISMALSVLIVIAIVPTMNELLDTKLSLSALLESKIIFSLIGILLVTGVLGGAYPAFFLSSFKPVDVMKGGGGRSSGKLLRVSLVTLQFAISIFMLIGTMIIFNQMQYVRNKNLGFDKDQMMQIDLNSRQSRAQWPVLKNKLLQSSTLKAAGTASTTPGSGTGKLIFSIENAEGVMEEKGIDNYRIDYEYFPTLGIEFAQGRNFSLEYPSDTSRAVIVNEAMVERMGWENPIGKKVQVTNDSIPSLVVGVVKSFHQQSLYDPIQPLMFLPGRNNGSALIKIEGDVSKGIEAVKLAWAEIFPTLPLEFTFLDQNFMEQYEADQLRGKLFLGFSLMTILIACLGLLGLASYTAEQRAKEMSIRKVLGANTQGLIGLIVGDFLKLILIAAVPASVGAWYYGNDWLETFQFHGELGPSVFLGVISATILVTLLTTGYHAFKSATANPAERLKYE